MASQLHQQSIWRWLSVNLRCTWQAAGISSCLPVVHFSVEGILQHFKPAAQLSDLCNCWLLM